MAASFPPLSHRGQGRKVPSNVGSRRRSCEAGAQGRADDPAKREVGDGARRRDGRRDHRGRRVRGLPAGGRAQRRSLAAGAALGGGRARPPSDVPYPADGRHADDHADRQLELRDRAGARPGRAHRLVAQGQGRGRLLDHQRHDVDPRPALRLRRLGPGGPAGVGVVARPGRVPPHGAVPGGWLGASWRQGPAARHPVRHGADLEAAVRRLPRGRRPGGLSAERRLQRPALRGGGGLPLHHRRRAALLLGPGLPQPDRGPREPAGGHRGPGRAGC